MSTPGSRDPLPDAIHSAEITQVEIDATVLFEREPCRCCDCCEGYCPDWDVADRWEHLYAFSTGGFDYLGTNRIMMRRDLLVGLPDDPRATDLPTAVNLAWAVVPDEKPARFDGHLSPLFWDIFDRAGLVCHESADPKMIHLYASGHHVGWTTRALPGKGIEEGRLALVRQISHELHLSVNDAATTLETVTALLSSSPGESGISGVTA